MRITTTECSRLSSRHGFYSLHNVYIVSSPRIKMQPCKLHLLHALCLPSVQANRTCIRIDPELRLRRGISMGSLPAVSRILRSHKHLIHNVDNTPGGYGNTNLHLAVLHNRTAIVQLLLDLGHEKDNISVNQLKQTPLHIAAHKGHVEIVNMLVCLGEKIAGVNKRDGQGRDAVMIAAAKGHDTVVQLLLTFAPPPPKELPHFLTVKPFSNARPSTASSSTDPHHPQNPARILLTNQDIDGNTALHHACSHGELMIQRTLLAAGANHEMRNCNDWLPIDYSATMAAQIYFRNLVAEHERDYVAAKQRFVLLPYS